MILSAPYIIAEGNEGSMVLSELSGYHKESSYYCWLISNRLDTDVA